jgi:hypothetical protein
LAQAGALPVVATLLFACRPSVPEVSQQRPANQPAGAPKRPSPPTAEPGSTPPSKIGLAEAAQEEATPTPAPTDPPVGALLERPHVTEGAPVDAAHVGVERPAEGHASDMVQRGLARLFPIRDAHPAMIEHMFAPSSARLYSCD